MGNGLRHGPGIGFAGGTGHGNCHKLGGAFSIAHQCLGKFHEHTFQDLVQQLAMIIQRLNLRHLRRSRADQHTGIIGGGVAVHRDPVKRLVRQGFHPLVQQRFGDGRIGGDKTQHGGHVRLDHARALGHTGNGDRHPVDLHATTGKLGVGIGGHDAFRRPSPMMLIQHGQSIGKAFFKCR